MILTASILYISAWAWLLTLTLKRSSLTHTGIKALIFTGLVFHIASTYHAIVTAAGFDLSFFKIAPLFFAVIFLLLLISSIQKPLLSLFLLLLPLGVVSLLVGYVFQADTGTATTVNVSESIAIHIILSILAYCLLTIAAFQAILLAYQERQLKKRALKRVIGILPPLQTMEALLFELIWAGYILLTLSIITGAIFISDIFTQKLSHKTVFSILSWGIYSTLLWGRLRYGWRGGAAIKWTLCGFCALILAYFGSKLVIEIIIGA